MGKGTYDDFIVAFSVAAAIFPVVPDVIATLFLSEGFVVSLGPLMRRKWKSKKVEQAAHRDAQCSLYERTLQRGHSEILHRVAGRDRQ